MQYEEGIKAWLLKRKISSEILEKFDVLFTDKITIPIHDENGVFVYNKYRRNPLLDENSGPKYWYDKGGRAQLYGAEFIKDESVVVICEGELDALVLWSQKIPAISSTSGAMTFNETWVELLKDKQVYVCLDNDQAGCKGAVRIVNIMPQAKVILLPDTAGVKDITDYYALGGDLRNLMQSAKHYVSYEDVDRDMKARRGEWKPTIFHEEWMKWWDSKQFEQQEVKTTKGDKTVEEVKKVPIRNIVKVDGQNRILCLWHSDSNPSMHVYEDNHAYCFACGKRADVIDIVREKLNLGFKEAVEYLNRI